MSKEQREILREKYFGKCAYCGRELENIFHEDHFNPIFRDRSVKPERAGENNYSNLMPSCPRCNLWKKTYTIEEFRKEINLQKERLMKIPGFRLALDYGLVEIKDNNAVFFYEIVNK